MNPDRILAAIRLLYPAEMTPTARNVLENILDAEELEAVGDPVASVLPEFTEEGVLQMSTMNIASEVVEIAAKAQAIADYERHFKRPVSEPDLLWSEDGMDADTMDDYRASARAALEAAAPYMFACEATPAEHDEAVCSGGITLCEECRAADSDFGAA